jgi:hypothetical protein
MDAESATPTGFILSHLLNPTAKIPKIQTVKRKKPRQGSDAAKVGRKRLKSGATGETSHEHATNMEQCSPNGKRNLMVNK